MGTDDVSISENVADLLRTAPIPLVGMERTMEN